MEQPGHDRPFSTDKEQTELYAYNPGTRSNITFDFTPAGRYARFSLKQIEWLTESVTKTMLSELEKERGKGVANIDVGPTEAFPLKGVQDETQLKSVTEEFKKKVEGIKKELEKGIFGPFFSRPFIITFYFPGSFPTSSGFGSSRFFSSFAASAALRPFSSALA